MINLIMAMFKFERCSHNYYVEKLTRLIICNVIICCYEAQTLLRGRNLLREDSHYSSFGLTRSLSLSQAASG